jgi:tRNA threonylcarbamoyl adenosine modification protein YeaZ
MTSIHPLLCIDTSGSQMMLALYNVSRHNVASGQLPTCIYQETLSVQSQRSHSALLIPHIQSALASLSIDVKQLGGIAINIGPGSFTGLRSGISTARTLGQFLQIPVYAFNLFELYTTTDSHVPTACLLDARKNQAYAAVLQPAPWGGSGQSSSPSSPLVSLQPPQLLLLEELPLFIELITANPHWVVSASLKKRLANHVAPELINVFEDRMLFTPERMAILCQQAPEAFQIAWQDLLPLYLQEPNATLRKPVPGKL